MILWSQWSAAEKADLIRRALELSDVPLSAGQIAPRVGAPSRNAVIGVCWRQGIRLPGKSGPKPKQQPEGASS